MIIGATIFLSGLLFGSVPVDLPDPDPTTILGSQHLLSGSGFYLGQADLCYKVVSEKWDELRQPVFYVTVRNTCFMPRKLTICFAVEGPGLNQAINDIGPMEGYDCGWGAAVQPGQTTTAFHRYGRYPENARYLVVSDFVYSTCVSDSNMWYSVFDSDKASPGRRKVYVVIRNKWDRSVDFAYCLDELGTCTPNKSVSQLSPKDRYIQEWEVTSSRKLYVNCLSTRRYN
jgi:hypothetical protein